MNDFQNFLKLIVEADDPEQHGHAPPPPGTFSGSLEDAKSPRDAYAAYSKELNALWETLKTTVNTAVTQIEKLHGHATGFATKMKDLGISSDKGLQQKLKAAAAPALPTFDRSKLAAIRGRHGIVSATPPAGGVTT